MGIVITSYRAQLARSPQAGRHLLAQFDAASVVVYQAHRSSIGRFAAAHGYFGGEFSLSRMSWIKPSFLWMMYRSGWGTKTDQDTVLAVRLRRDAFDEILRAAVPSSFDDSAYESEELWRHAVALSSARFQWDPDRDPSGRPLDRRAIQLGLRGEVLRRYASEGIVAVEDISGFVAAQRRHVAEQGWPRLDVPREEEYAVLDPSLARSLGLPADSSVGQPGT